MLMHSDSLKYCFSWWFTVASTS